MSKILRRTYVTRNFIQGEDGHHMTEQANLLIGKIHKRNLCLDAKVEGKRWVNDRIFHALIALQLLRADNRVIA